MPFLRRKVLVSLVLCIPIIGFAQVLVIDTVDVGNGPAGVGVNPQTNRIYVTN